MYGTHIYKRFSPSILDSLIQSSSGSSGIPTEGLVAALDPKKWDQTITPFRLPKGLRLVLADVDAGTSTPSFIKGILKWREESPEESEMIWSKLYAANTRLVKALASLREMESMEEYDEVLEAAAGLPIEQVSREPNSSILSSIPIPESSFPIPYSPNSLPQTLTLCLVPLIQSLLSKLRRETHHQSLVLVPVLVPVLYRDREKTENNDRHAVFPF